MLSQSQLRYDFDKALRKQAWNIAPEKERVIPSSSNPVMNAATAIAICAYPQLKHLNNGGKAHKYAQALFSYMFRISQRIGDIEQLPPWARQLKAERMWDRLVTGNRNLMRSLVMRDLIVSALINKMQSDNARHAEPSTFTMHFSPNLKTMKIEIPIKQTDGGYYLAGKIPEDGRSSLRAAIKNHLSALSEFMGPSPRIEGTDEEGFIRTRSQDS